MGLGMLCIAVMCLLIGLVFNQSDDGTVVGALGNGLVAVSAIIGVVGLFIITLQLLRGGD